MKNTITDRLMNEHIRMPGFPQVVVTRGFAYQWLKECGWSPRERGFASLDYLAFGTKATDEPLVSDEDRDYWLNQVRDQYLRD